MIPGDGFSLSNNEVKIRLKDMVVISEPRVVTFGFQLNASNDEQTLNDRFPDVKQVRYQEINQPVFLSRFREKGKIKGRGGNMFYVDFRRIFYLFVLCTTLFPDSYYSVNPSN